MLSHDAMQAVQSAIGAFASCKQEFLPGLSEKFILAMLLLAVPDLLNALSGYFGSPEVAALAADELSTYCEFRFAIPVCCLGSGECFVVLQLSDC